MLLGGGHGQRLAVVETPRLGLVPVQAVVGSAHVAALVLGAEGQVVPRAEPHQRRLQQPAAGAVIQHAADLADFQAPAVEPGPYRGHRAVGFTLRSERQGDQHMAVVQCPPLAAPAGINLRCPRVIPFELRRRRPVALRIAHHVHRPPRSLRPGQRAVAVIHVVPDGQHGVGWRVMLRHHVADPFLVARLDRPASQAGDGLRWRKRFAQVARLGPVHVTEDIRTADGL